MKIVKELNIPSAYFYNTLIDSVRYDIEMSTSESIAESKLENYEYTKIFSANKSAKLTILEVEKNKKYSFKTETISNTFVSKYIIESLPTNKILVTYKEKNEANNQLKKINDQLFGILLGYFKKKKFIKMLDSIENSYYS